MDFRWVVLSAGYMGLTLSARGNHIGALLALKSL